MTHHPLFPAAQIACLVLMLASVAGCGGGNSSEADAAQDGNDNGHGTATTQPVNCPATPRACT